MRKNILILILLSPLTLHAQYEGYINQGFQQGYAFSSSMMQSSVQANAQYRMQFPLLKPEAKTKDEAGNTAQYYSDMMYRAQYAGMSEDAKEYRAKMKALHSIDIENYKKQNERRQKTDEKRKRISSR